MASVPSVFEGRGKVMEGTEVASAVASSVVPARLQRLGGDDVHRSQGLKAGAALGAGAGDDQLLDLTGGFGGLDGAGQKGDGRDGREESIAMQHGVFH